MLDTSDKVTLPVQVAAATNRSFYAGTVAEFLAAEPQAVIGQLTSRHLKGLGAAVVQQLQAWEGEVSILKNAFRSVGKVADDWWILLEVPLLRLGKRIDAAVLATGVVGVIEFKIGGTKYEAHQRTQAELYAQLLRDFHQASQQRLVVPILCVDQAPPAPVALEPLDGVAELLLTNATTLTDALSVIAENCKPAAGPLNASQFDLSPYRPTPTIVEAARALYAGHQIVDIGRGDAADAELQAAANALLNIVLRSQQKAERIVCFVTGAPGAGKTLLGLDLALKKRDGHRLAAFLSGNRPLVHVLTEALAADSAARNQTSKKRAKYEADSAIQNLLRYLKEHTEGANPPEHVIVFDEAQRAWDEEIGKKLMGRPKSEPELFLDILSRLDWSCLVCLVGPGQEINRGEGGLELWGKALALAAAAGRPWSIVAAPQAIDGGPDVAGAGLLSGAGDAPLDIQRDPRLHLSNAIRAYRNPLQGQWVASLLESNIPEAKSIADRMRSAPAFLTRDFKAAKNWLRAHRRGGRSVGLLTSSGAVRLIGDGIPPSPRSNELGPIGHWFLKPFTDFRGSGALETPMSEFGCQGLELDYVGICWGGDLLWRQRWTPRKMTAPKWGVLKSPEAQRFRLNAYRVLLTRGRAGTVIYVPSGDIEDPTRSPAEFDAIASTLAAAGCRIIETTSRQVV